MIRQATGTVLARVHSTAMRSARFTRVLNSSAEKTTMKTGDVNCKTIAFAAVVSLLAQVKQV